MKKIIVIFTLLVLTTTCAYAQQPLSKNLQQQKIRVEKLSKTQNYKQIEKSVDKYSKQYKVNRKTILALILTESGFNPNASNGTCHGLMQLHTRTAKARGVTNVFNIDQNVFGGTKHYAGLLARYKGNEQLALSAYNAGGGNVDKSLRRYGVIPKYTLAYVKKVQSYKQLF